jgi:hypothetical protein
MKILISAVLGAIFLSPAATHAQQDIAIRQFVFKTTSTMGEFKQESFCLPQSQIWRVQNVTVLRSNSPSTVNVRNDSSANCFVINVNLPPANTECVKIPKMGMLTVHFENQCSTVPNEIGFEIKYTNGPIGGAFNTGPTYPSPELDHSQTSPHEKSAITGPQ